MKLAYSAPQFSILSLTILVTIYFTPFYEKCGANLSFVEHLGECPHGGWLYVDDKFRVCARRSGDESSGVLDGLGHEDAVALGIKRLVERLIGGGGGRPVDFEDGLGDPERAEEVGRGVALEGEAILLLDPGGVHAPLGLRALLARPSGEVVFGEEISVRMPIFTLH